MIRFGRRRAPLLTVAAPRPCQAAVWYCEDHERVHGDGEQAVYCHAGHWVCPCATPAASSPQTGLDRVRAAVEQARGGPAPSTVRGYA